MSSADEMRKRMYDAISENEIIQGRFIDEILGVLDKKQHVVFVDMLIFNQKIAGINLDLVSDNECLTLNRDGLLQEVKRLKHELELAQSASPKEAF